MNWKDCHIRCYWPLDNCTSFGLLLFGWLTLYDLIFFLRELCLLYLSMCNSIKQLKIFMVYKSWLKQYNSGDNFQGMAAFKPYIINLIPYYNEVDSLFCFVVFNLDLKWHLRCQICFSADLLPRWVISSYPVII